MRYDNAGSVKLNDPRDRSGSPECQTDCVGCEHLSAELRTLERIYQLTRDNLTAARTNSDAVQYAQLLDLADNAKIDLDRMSAAIGEHRHAAHVSR